MHYSITLQLRLQQVVTPLANWQHAFFSACRSPVGRFHTQQQLCFHVNSRVLVDDKNLWTLIHSPTFVWFELVHCNEIVGLLVQCEKPTPETTCPLGKLGEKTTSESSFPNSSHRGFEPEVSSWSPYHAARAPNQFNHLTRWTSASCAMYNNPGNSSDDFSCLTFRLTFGLWSPCFSKFLCYLRRWFGL